jgi:hypothetical protein
LILQAYADAFTFQPERQIHMKFQNSIVIMLLGAAVACTTAAAQAPVPTVDPERHGNLAAAQQAILAAFSRISEAQRDNDSHLGGHAGRAKELLREANDEIQAAADTADQNAMGGQAFAPPAVAASTTASAPPAASAPPTNSGPPASSAPPATSAQAPPPGESAPPPPPPPPAPVDLTGSWTIYAYNVNQPGSSLKTVQLFQSGNIISGTFHGPHQHGKLQGWVNGSHVEFSTDTSDVLTFRGEITSTGMSGLYGIHGEHAPWRAERSN